MKSLEDLLSTVDENLGETKTAAAPAERTVTQLIEDLRKEAAAPVDVRAEAARELREKTAEVYVIADTIRHIEQAMAPGEKTASAPDQGQLKTAAFIKAALERGHSPEDIAEFLTKQSGALGAAVNKAKEVAGLAPLAWRGFKEEYPRASKVLPLAGTFLAGRALGKRSGRKERQAEDQAS